MGAGGGVCFSAYSKAAFAGGAAPFVVREPVVDDPPCRRSGGRRAPGGRSGTPAGPSCVRSRRAVCQPRLRRFVRSAPSPDQHVAPWQSLGQRDLWKLELRRRYMLKLSKSGSACRAVAIPGTARLVETGIVSCLISGDRRADKKRKRPRLD